MHIFTIFYSYFVVFMKRQPTLDCYGVVKHPPDKRVKQDDQPLVTTTRKYTRISQQIFLSILCAITFERVGKKSHLYCQSPMIAPFQMIWKQWFYPLCMAIVVRWELQLPSTIHDPYTFCELDRTHVTELRHVVIDGVLCIERKEETTKYIRNKITKWHTGDIVHETERFLWSTTGHILATPKHLVIVGSKGGKNANGRPCIGNDGCWVKHMEIAQLYKAISDKTIESELKFKTSASRLPCNSIFNCFGDCMFITPSILYHNKGNASFSSTDCLYDVEQDRIIFTPLFWHENNTPIYGAGICHVFDRGVSLLLMDGRIITENIPSNEMLTVVTPSGFMITTTIPQEFTHTTTIIFRNVAQWIDDMYTAEESRYDMMELQSECNKQNSDVPLDVISFGMSRAIVFCRSSKMHCHLEPTVSAIVVKRTTKQDISLTTMLLRVPPGNFDAQMQTKILDEERGIGCLIQHGDIYRYQDIWISIVNLDVGTQLLHIVQIETPPHSQKRTTHITKENTTTIRTDLPLISGIDGIVENQWIELPQFVPTK
jgi:hypothetical protein